MYDFDADIADCARSVAAAMDRLLRSEALPGPGAAPERLVKAMRHGAVDGGKRLRPLLVRQAASVFGVGPEASRIAGLAVECVHCYSLIHDDLPAMDDDDLRRGRRSVHKEFDDATAILAGDALLTHAFGLLAGDDCHPDPVVRTRLVAELASGAGAGGMVGGQMRDIEGERAGLSQAEIGAMQAMKTGALIRAAVRIGALLGAPDDASLRHLTDYAEAAGRAFQLADDILDVTAGPEILGKATGKDAARGKQTLVSRIGIEAARRHLGETIHDALTALIPFGDAANGLRETAKYFAARAS